MPTVVLIGTLDTKGQEYAWLRDRLRDLGCEVVLVDAGVGEPAGGRRHRQRAGGRGGGEPTSRALRAAGDRGAAVTAMGEGAAAVLAELHAEGRLDARARGGRQRRVLDRGAGRHATCRSACPSSSCRPWRPATCPLTSGPRT